MGTTTQHTVTGTETNSTTNSTTGTKTKTRKKYTYHKSHSYEVVKNGEKVNFVTQLYKIGVYGIVNGDSRMQGNFTPSSLVSMERKLKSQEEKGEIKNLHFGSSITVSDETSFWEEVIK